MLEIFEKWITVLKADATLTAMLAADADGNTAIFTGPVDVTMETQAELLYPMITLSLVSEVSRSVPPSRDTMVQLDIWSRTSQLDVENIYEQILVDLNYLSGDQSTAHIFWQRLGGAVDQYETDRRIWHRSCTFTVWSIK